MGWNGSAAEVRRHRKKLPLRKRHFFVIEKCVEDVKQDQKIAPDFVESIIRATDPVNKELLRLLMKMDQFRSNITKIRLGIKEVTVSTFWMSRNLTDSHRRPTQPASPVSFNPFSTS